MTCRVPGSFGQWLLLIMRLCAGHHVGQASITGNGDVALAISWQDPVGGSGTEVFHLVDTNTLHVSSSITVDGQTVRYTNVHFRQM